MLPVPGSMAVPRHRFHPLHGTSGDDRGAATPPFSSSHATSTMHMFRLRTSQRCAVVSLCVAALLLASTLLWLSAAHSSFGFLFSSTAIDDPSLDILTPLRNYPPAELVGTTAGIDYIASHVLFFLHVPKTAGQSFTTALNLVIDPYKPILNDRLTELTNVTNNRLARARKAGARRLDLAFMQREETSMLLKEERHAQFSSMFTSRVLVFGHTDVLIANQFEADGRHVDFITMLRAPEERVLSHYCYMLTTWQEAKRHTLVYPSWFKFLNAKSLDTAPPPPPQPTPPGTTDIVPALPFPPVTSYPVHQLSPASFMYYYRSTPLDRIDNWHTRAYSGCLHTPIPTTHAQDVLCNSTQLMLAEAKRQLRSFLFIGLTEHYNQSVALLNHTLTTDNLRPSAAHMLPPTPATNQSAHSRHLLAITNRNDRLIPTRNNSAAMRRKTVRVLNRNRKKGHCIEAISGNSTSRMEQLMDEVRAVEWMDIRLYEYASRLFWARVEEVERIRPGFTMPLPVPGVG